MTTASPALLAIIDKAKAYIASAQETAADGLTLSEMGFLVVGLLRLTVAAIDTVPMAGEDRKQFVLDCVDLLFEAVADKMIPAVFWPIWLVSRSQWKQIVLAVSAGVIEQLLPMIRGGQR